MEHDLCFLYRKACFVCHYEKLATAGARSLFVLLETMLRLLSLGLNNSWSMVCVSSLGYHVPPIVMKLIQQLEHVFNSLWGITFCLL